jgi:cobalt-zinc-cadmium resistance protein CzcA
VSQTIHFPTLYTRQKKLFSEEWQQSNYTVALKEIELKREVSRIFFTLIYLSEKEKLLKKCDSLYAEFLLKSELRFKKGESNILEKTTAESQKGAIQLQLTQLIEERESTQNEFLFLLNSKERFIPESSSLKLKFVTPTEEISSETHPYLSVLNQQKRISLANTKLERAKLLPQLIFGYNNTSIIGIGADDVFYSKSNRFQSVQFGLGIPIFGGAQKSKIEASKIEEAIAQNEFDKEKLFLENQIRTTLTLYKSSLEKLDYYEKTALPNADVVMKTAGIQFINGEINYLDWVILVNQSITTKSNYIDAIHHYNQIVIQLNYLTSK